MKSATRRGFVALVAVALGAAACGSGTPAADTTSKTVSPAAALSDALASITNSQSAKFVFSLVSPSLPNGPSGVVTSVSALVHGLSLGLLETTPSGTLRDAGTAIDYDATVSYLGKPLAEVIFIHGGELYVHLSIANWTALPLKLSAADRQQIAAAAPLLGGRWLSLPPSAITSKLPKGVSGATGDLSPEQAQRVASSLQDALKKATTVSAGASSAFSAPGSPTTTVITASGRLSDLASSMSGTLRQLAAALGDALPSGDLGTSVSGSYSLRLYTSSQNVLNQLNASVTGKGKSATVLVSVSHPSAQVTAPPNSTALPSSVLSEI